MFQFGTPHYLETQNWSGQDWNTALSLYSKVDWLGATVETIHRRYISIWIWVNYSDLTVISQEPWLVIKGNYYHMYIAYLI
jgi:hypothetical protein